MNRNERAYLNRMNQHVDAFDFKGQQHADADPVSMRSANVPEIKGNPRFDATFNLKFKSLYFTLTSGTYTKIAPSGLAAALQTDLPFFVFGNNDYFGSGYKNLKRSFDIGTDWVYGRPGIFGKDDFEEFAFDGTVEAQLRTGDLVIPFTSALPGAGTTTLALNVIRCPEVAYGSLLSMLDSARFNVVGFRYVINDTAKLAQYQNQLEFKNLSLFGKAQNDSLTPDDYKVPEQFQNGIVDVPVGGGWGRIDKYIGWGFLNTFDLEESGWTVFVQQIRKMPA